MVRTNHQSVARRPSHQGVRPPGDGGHTANGVLLPLTLIPASGILDVAVRAVSAPGGSARKTGFATRGNTMRLRSTIAAAAIAAGSLATVGVAPVAAAPPSAYTCMGTLSSPGFIPGGTYSSLTMPAGSFCFVVGAVTVTHPVSVGTGAGLAVAPVPGASLTIAGPVTIGTQGAFGSFDNTTPVHIGGPVSVGQDGAFAIGTESPFDPQVNSIAGPVSGRNASAVQIHNAVIGGPVRLTGGGGDNAIIDFFAPFGAFNDLEDNSIGGPVSITGYQGVWTGVIRDAIHGPFTFSNNVQANPDEWDIGSDTIYGPATCNDNVPAPNMGTSAGGPSTVFGPIRGDQAATCTSA